MIDQGTLPPSLPSKGERQHGTTPNSNQVERGRVGIALLTAILAVSSSSIFIRFAQADAPSLVIAALRLTCATLLLAPLALTRHRDELSSLTQREILLGAVSEIF